MRRVSSTDHETYIPAEDRPSTPKNATLVRKVLAEAQKIVDSGHNAKFGCVDALHQKEVEERYKALAEGEKLKIVNGSEYNLACQVIAEAKKIVGMGYNAKISCGEGDQNASEQEKRRAYYEWKRMNR